MPIEPVFRKINAKEKTGDLVCQVKVECKTEVPSSAVARVLNENACFMVTLGEVISGRAEFIGKATFFICYADEEGVKKCECGAEIKDSFLSDAIAEGDEIKLFWESDKVETDLSGVKMSVSAYLTVKGVVIRTSEYQALTSGENMFCNAVEMPIVKSYGSFSSSYAAEEEFEINYPVKEVLSHSAEVVITQIQCGVGTVIADGEIYLKEILLQSGDKSDIIRENRVMSFRAEAECEDAMPQLSANCRAFIKSLKTDVGVDEEKNISTLTAQVFIEFGGDVYSTAEETFAGDAFSTENELTLVKTRVRTGSESAPQCVYSKITARANTDDIGAARIAAVSSEKINVLSAEKKDGGLAVTGTLSLNVLFIEEDGSVIRRKAETPFETVIACSTEDGEKVNVGAIVKSASAKIVTLSEMECSVEAVFTVTTEKEVSAEIVSAVETAEEKTVTNAAVSVYIPLAGEGLWELSKRLNVCPETLVATNSDLQFPLTGTERIVVFRQK